MKLTVNNAQLIAKGWKISTLEEVTQFIDYRGKTPKKTEQGLRLITAKNVKKGYLQKAPMEFVNPEIYDSWMTRGIPNKGDILFTTEAPLGNVAQLDIDEKVVFAQRIIIIHPYRNILNATFLKYLLLSGFMQKRIHDKGTGATATGIKSKLLKQIEVAYPLLPEQQRIVEILDESFEGIDRAIANTEKNLANARELLQASIFYGCDSQKWKINKVVDLLASKESSIRTGPFGSQLLHSEFVDKGIAVLGIDNAVNNEFKWNKRRFITPEKYKKLSRYTVKPGDILITIMGTCGRCAVVPENIPIAINTKHLCCITLDKDKCLPHFLHIYFLYHPTARKFLEQKAKGSIMAGLNMSIIKELPVFLPPISEQEILIDRCNFIKNGVQRLEAIYQRKLEDLQELKQSILHKAFTGELTNPTVKEDAA
ncbi:restriction endonuclease subunit S [Limnoraphis robusta]|uniref:Restriction endonuclease subunit S n=1 Tax=Limnoraphis robusta CCNP1315 TaxID=3110306 RepID=A0ABU5U324_9CYAN|nr:restriction endonuclease subunit S [Limnoraphis robusta]MEA5521415.1 restriction endonuclease subunit S [Limnoraphis robusta CCNP1315]MEA5544348.1 restriction endonuclease subunit S [Limnoraphis robusta CCNP1324]